MITNMDGMMTTMTALAPTSEQQAVIDAAISGSDLVIQAGAGTGKSETLRMTSAEMRKHIMYVAFNKTTADDASKRFPSHVQCRTAHSLAYRSVGYQYKDRLTGPRQPSFAAAKILGTHTIDLGDGVQIKANPMASIALDTVRRFCYSADTEIQDHHVPHQNGVNKFKHPLLVETILPLARKAWDDLSGIRGQLKFEHDFYLKHYCLTKPNLNIDVIMLDEAQDSNPVLVDLIKNQTKSQQIVVGDTYQSMYQWRGSVDALGSWDNAEALYLSQSWRFGQPIADQANVWLDILGAQLRLTGNPGQESVVVPNLPSPDAILCRTNAGALGQVMDLLAGDVKVALVGGGRPLVYLVESLAQLKAGKTTSHPELFIFQDWDQLTTFASESSGRDLKPVVDMLDKHGADVLLSALNALQSEERAETVVSTVHKCVHPDTLVQTPQGLIPIRSIPDFGEIATPTGIQSYHSKFTKKDGPILRLTTKRGYQLGVSPEHGLTTWRDGQHQRVTAQDLVVGDWLRLRIGPTGPDVSTMPTLPTPASPSSNAKMWDTPSHMSVELGELLGLLVADGCMFSNGSGVRVVKRYLSVIERFGVLVKDLFGYEVKIRDHAGTPCGEVSSVVIGRWLESLGGISWNNKFVPEVILSSPLSVQAAFLRGLFEDGTVNEKDGLIDHIHWENYDARVAEMVQIMLLRLGITSSRKNHHGINSVYIYAESARFFAQEIGFIAPEKNARLVGRFPKDKHSLIPLSRDELAALEKVMSVTDKQNARFRGYITVSVARKVIDALGTENSGVLPDRLGWLYQRIFRIDHEHGETMCVTVPDGERFLQNGFDGWNSKGREWPSVKVATDFAKPDDKETSAREIPPTEAMVAYVAVTRAREQLDLGGLAWVHDHLPPSGEELA
jgi:hypothetical protein